MLITLPLKDMSVEEKIQTMETLWDDLCKNAGSLESPQWHGDILQEREKAIKDGTDEFIDWESAKKGIRNSVS
ncbi:MAG: addiction module protein [Desulfobacteraceae bacterium]|nr:addiction module protein [Desulfobacteraceae bacterium]